MTRYRKAEAALRRRSATNLTSVLILAAAAAAGVAAPVPAQEADVLTIDQLLSIESVVSGSPAWSPDERSIAFAGDRYGNYDIWTVEVDTRRARRITSEKNYEVFPTWTPDSRRILYVRLDDAWEDHDVIEVAPDGSGARTVLQDRDFFDYGAGSTFGYPQVSPDGGQVLFRSHRSGWINYWLAPIEGGEPRPVAAADADQGSAVWSPDGRSIAYIENHNGHHDLRVVSSDGGKPRVLASPDGGVASSPSWSPDSRAIAYLKADLVTPQDLHVVSVESGESRQLTFSMPAGNLADRLVLPDKVHYPSTDGYSIPAYLYRPVESRPAVAHPASCGSTAAPPRSSTTPSSSTCSSSRSADTRCCCPTSGAVPATGRTSPTQTTAVGATATWKTCSRAPTS